MNDQRSEVPPVSGSETLPQTDLAEFANDDKIGPDCLLRGASGSLTEYHRKFADETHNYIREQIRNADQKAGIFFTVFAGLLAYLNSKGFPAHWVKPLGQWTGVDELGFFAMVGLACGSLVLISVVLPRLGGSRRGLVFFNAIAEYGRSKEYLHDVLARSSEELGMEKIQHCYDLARICKTKFRLLTFGFFVGSFGAGLGILLLLLSEPH